MKEEHKTKEQLMNELAEMRQRIAEWEASEVRRERAEEALRESEGSFRAMADNANDGIMIAAGKGAHVYANRRMAEITGYSIAELLKTTISDLVHPDQLREVVERFQRRLEGKPAPSQYEIVFVRKDGESVPLEMTSAKTVWRGQPAAIVVLRDLTGRKRAEEKIEHLNLVLRAVRNVNQLITRERDRGRLLQGACETLIETCGYRSAWTALLDESEGLVTTAEAGLGEDFLPLVERLKRGELTDCVQRALKQSGVVVTEDPSSTCAGCSLSSTYDGRGAMTIRLEYGGKVYGLLSVSIPRDLVADEEEQALFEEVAGDIAFALYSIELEEEHKQADEALKRRMEQLAALGQASQVVTASLELDQVLAEILSLASEVVASDHTAVALMDETGKIRRSSENLPGVPAMEYRAREEGLTSLMVRSHQPVVVSEIGEDGAISPDLGEGAPRFFNPPIVEAGIKSCAGLPLIVKDRLLGVLYLHSVRPRTFDGQLPLLTTFANQVAIALENARLFEQTKAALEALRVSEERFALAVQGANDGVWDWEIKNNTLYWSPRMKELLGYADDELDVDFDTFESHVHPDDGERIGAAIEAHLKHRVPYNVEQRLRAKSGEYRWFNARGQALWDEAGNPIRMVGSSTDITERKWAEKALKEYSERLEEMVEERTKELRDAQEQLIRKEKLAVLGQLAGGVGHDLRNPLGAINNAVYFLNMVLEEPDPEVKETLEILSKEVKTSEKIISSLLDFARAKPPTRRKVNINEVVQEALSRIAVPENVEVVSQLDEALPIILADPDQLVQVFGNIILNAAQAMPEGGHLVVKSEVPSPEWVAVSFTDTGVGISEEDLEMNFEPLFTTKAKGVGLGLAVTRTLVEGHGGIIEVESEVGVGTTFTVRLPMSDS
jgi:PAS domain S-box-containing protein